MVAYVGVDISSNCIGITVLKDGKARYVTLLNRWELTVAKEFDEGKVMGLPLMRDLSKVSDLRVVLFDRAPNAVPNRRKTKDPANFIRDLSLWEINHMSQCEALSELFYKVMSEELAVAGCPAYGLVESLAIGKDTTNLTQVCEFSWPIKKALRDLVGRGRVFRISSSEVKQLAAGNGNAVKVDMLNAFIMGASGQLHAYVKANAHSITKKMKAKIEVVKPIEDVVDSYWIARFLETNIEKFPR